MKKITLILLAIIATSTVGLAQNVSVISGKWKRDPIKEIKLFSTERGKLREISTYQVDPDGGFYFAFSPDSEKFYTIGVNNNNPLNSFSFYFKPGDRLNVEITEESYTLVGENTPENMEMERWHNHILNMERISVYFHGSDDTFREFFPALESILNQPHTEQYSTTRNFKNQVRHFRENEILHLAMYILRTPRTEHPTMDDFPQYYRNIDITAITRDQNLVSFPWGKDIIKAYIMTAPKYQDNDLARQLDGAVTKFYDLPGIIIPAIANDTLKGEVVLDHAIFRSAASYREFEKRYKKYLIMDEQKADLLDRVKDMAINVSGEQASDFTFADMDGKMHSLSDYRGKVVYIDIWATWCGPCLAQVPHLKALEEEYRSNPDLVFMSVSSDNPNDYDKWKDMVLEKELVGIQLFGGAHVGEQLMTPYKIGSIPRFLLIGKDGNIVSDNAPRPRSQEIRQLFDEALKE